MSTYRTSMMLYSSVLALSFMSVSDGFCSDKETREIKAEARTSGEKTSNSSKDFKNDTSTSKSTEKEKAVKKEIATALTDEEDAALEKKQREQIEQEQKRKDFASKTRTVTNKYNKSLQSITGKDGKIIENELVNHSEKIRIVLLEALDNSRGEEKNEIFDKITKVLKRKLLFIQSKRESVGEEDAAWFNDLYVAAEKQLKRLEKLSVEFAKNKGNKNDEEKTRLIYADKINSFLASYSVFTACTHYLGTAKVYCNDKAISSNHMKVQFPEFSSKAFKEAAVPSDILSGKRDPLASINGYKFYAIGKDEYKKDEFSSKIPAESEDGKLIAKATKGDYQELLKPEHGGLILSSRMIQKAGMDKPICVFYAFAVDAGKEIVSRFSLVHESEEVAGRQLTAQLIKAEGQPEYDALSTAVNKLRKAVNEDALKEADKPKKKETENGDKPKTKATTEEAADKPKSKATTEEATDKQKSKATTEEAADKQKSKVTSEEVTDKPKKKATIEEATDKPKSKATTEEAADKQKSKVTSEEATDKPKSKATEDKSANKTDADETTTKAVKKTDKDEATTKTATIKTATIKAVKKTDKDEATTTEEAATKEKKATKKAKKENADEKTQASTPTPVPAPTPAPVKEQSFLSKLFSGPSDKAADKAATPAA